MGFADSPATRQALAPYGIRVQGARWRWRIGLKGGTFPPHRHINGQVRSSENEFDALPGEDVNGESCNCAVVPVYRTPDGRLAKPGLTPVFQPPVTAALPAPLDLTPIADLMGSVMEREWTINLPPAEPTPVDVHVAAPLPGLPPVVNMDMAPLVAALSEQTVQVVIPDGAIQVHVTVEAPAVNVEAPNVTVEPQITVNPAPVKVIDQGKGTKTVEFRRGANGLIENATVTQ